MFVDSRFDQERKDVEKEKQKLCSRRRIRGEHKLHFYCHIIIYLQFDIK